MILAQRETLAEREAALTEAQNEAKVRALEIERLKLQLAKARRERFGQSSERGKLLVEQLELAIAELEETQAEEETKAEIAAPETARAPRRPPQRGPRKLPENLPVERVIEPAPCVCGKCGGDPLRKLGEVVSKTLECEPRRWKIIERVREKFSCRDCEAISEPLAPSHPIPRGFAGPSLLAMILVGKFCDHLPLNRQSAAFAREGVELDVSTLADWVGACAAALDPILAELRRHVLAAERLHVVNRLGRLTPPIPIHSMTCGADRHSDPTPNDNRTSRQVSGCEAANVNDGRREGPPRKECAGNGDTDRTAFLFA